MAKWADDPMSDWLLKHLLLEHQKEPDDFEGESWQYILGFHDGEHGFIGETYDHAGYHEAREAQRKWLDGSLGVPVRVAPKETPGGDE